MNVYVCKICTRWEHFHTISKTFMLAYLLKECRHYEIDLSETLLLDVSETLWLEFLLEVIAGG